MNMQYEYVCVCVCCGVLSKLLALFWIVIESDELGLIKGTHVKSGDRASGISRDKFDLHVNFAI